jgi:hypothetical protein
MWPGHLVIRDYKYGMGVRVDALDNPQLYLYAYAAFREWDWLYGFDAISIGVLQPRLEHFDVIELTRAELLAFAERGARDGEGRMGGYAARRRAAGADTEGMPVVQRQGPLCSSRGAARTACR